MERAVISAIYLFAYWYADKHPKSGLSIGIGVYIIMIILYAIVLPASIYSGVIAKVLILYFGIRGILAAGKLKAIEDRLEVIGE